MQVPIGRHFVTRDTSMCELTHITPLAPALLSRLELVCRHGRRVATLAEGNRRIDRARIGSARQTPLRTQSRYPRSAATRIKPTSTSRLHPFRRPAVIINSDALPGDPRPPEMPASWDSRSHRSCGLPGTQVGE